MKVKLDVLERVILPQILPVKGSYVEQTICQGAMKVLNLTEEEIKKFDFTSKDGQMQWESSEDVSIELSDAAVVVIKTALKTLNDESEITQQHMTLYEKFVVNAPSTEDKVAGKIDKKE